MRSLFFNVVAALTSIIVVASAGDKRSGGISGKVFALINSSSGPGMDTVGTSATIQISGFGSGNKPMAIESDTAGNFEVDSLLFGKYTCLASIPLCSPGSIETLVVHPGERASVRLFVDCFLGYTEKDAQKDIANGDVKLFLYGMIIPLAFDEISAIAAKYGFAISTSGCYPLSTDRYNAYVYAHLDSLNGPGWRHRYNLEVKEAEENWERSKRAR